MEALDVLLDNFLSVPGGTFLMGSANTIEAPLHEVAVAPFQLGMVPVTNYQFARFVAAGGYQTERWWLPDGWQWRTREKIEAPAFWQQPPHHAPLQPVVGVTWYESMAYCEWLRETTAQKARLPTEAEWERAARGDDGRPWSWGHAWNPTHCTVQGTTAGSASLVLSHQQAPGPYGHLDLSGNIYEWLSTRWGRNWQTCDYPYPYQANDGREGQEGRYARVMRGGSWYDPPASARTFGRARFLPASRASNIGFRLARSLP